jgi:chemosensory pili system protein ChpA (sensor histidine kinase/response regulator)
LRRIGNDLVFHVEERMYPAKRIDAVLGMHGQGAAADDQSRYRSVLIVSSTSGSTAILVEAILASRELVVKTLGRYVPRLRGIVGATILGDGTVTPVVDVVELMRAPIRHEAQHEHSVTLAVPHGDSRPLALVVDDSLSARRSLAQLLADSGFRVETARDGIEAVAFLEKNQPDVLFVDLEMPRMNGIELTSHVRSRATTSKLPVIMVTSRSTRRHREQAEAAGIDAYLTKPFAEDALLQQTHALLAQTA